MRVKYTLNISNKRLWKDLGWDLRASSQTGIGTNDFLDEFVDDNYNHLTHPSGLTITEDKDHELLSLHSSPSFEIDGEQLILIHEMFGQGLFRVTEYEGTKAEEK